MRGSVRMIRLLHVPLLIVGLLAAVSLLRSAPAAPFGAPPPGATSWRGEWSDRAITRVRWHAPIVVAGSYTSRSTTGRKEVFQSARRVAGPIKGKPDGTLEVRELDVDRFDTRRALVLPAFLSLIGLLTE